MACLLYNPYSNIDYDSFLLEMEQSYVKLKIAEKEEKLRRDREKKTMKPVNGTAQKDGKYFLVRLEMEVEKINSLINSTEKDSRLAQLPDEASGKIRNAVGKAHLLLNKRFKQFRELCRDNIENDPDKKETKSSDLQGYWDMMYIQIEDVHALFNDIDKLRANNWLVTEDATDGYLKPQDDTKKGSSSTPKGKRKSTGKSPRTKTKTIDDEKVKREARSRLAAARKQAKLRAQQEATASNGGSPDDGSPDEGSPDSSINGSLNGSWTADKNEEAANSSLNTSLNSSSNSSSVELLSNGVDSLDIAAESRPVLKPNIEVNSVA
ncbi:disks large-associated protein 1-like isoform X1 [Clytia hemisphaerica]|uniref:Uncharacterized protein n=2 Tax=Clytia hemisphaerica TaxID=252671 RepID=A0A7M5V657_9CNID